MVGFKSTIYFVFYLSQLFFVPLFLPTFELIMFYDFFYIIFWFISCNFVLLY